jgi:uncharacterized damage-inducible protein DinB
MDNLKNSMTAGDKEKVLALLRATRERFLQSFAGMTDEECRRRPHEKSWCVLDTVEHLTKAETTMLGLITKTRRPRPADAPNREEAFMRMVPDRSRKMESPESGRPTGSFAGLADAEAHFKGVRERVIRFAEETDEDLRTTEVTHPHPAAGNVSTYEMMIVIAQHAERHAAQIAEIRAGIKPHAGTAGQS